MSRNGRATGFALALLLALATRVDAGDYHTSAASELYCSDCHSIHYSQAGAAALTKKGEAYAGPKGKLLRGNSVNALCLMCHDGWDASAPDVNDAAAYVPSAGKFAPGGVPTEANRHSLGSAAVAPGGTWSNADGLNCADCHNPHGNAYYRNLRTDPGGTAGKTVTYVSNTYDAVSAVFQKVFVTLPRTALATHFAVSNADYRKSDNGLSEWCKGCHANFHGAGGDANMGGSLSGDTNTGANHWLRHPTRDVTMAEGVTNKHVDDTYSAGTGYWFSSLNSRVPVISNGGTIPGTKAASDNEVFCGSCHKAHGSTHQFATVWDDPATAALEDGTSQLQTCQQCHYQ
ncbi:MAG: hypothetical protein HY922_08845 [Elusimicrobia bacterium]|nr:hypothetical protein [Elusimicrobiota bacterium]